MPKALSLKKVSQAGPPKNQKSITHFFKNPNLDKQKPKLDIIKSQTPEKQSSKRKAESPIDLDAEEVIIVTNSPKKQKIQNSHSDKAKSTCKSPNKENGINHNNINLSPKKNSINSSSPSKVNKGERPKLSFEIATSNKVNPQSERSPLSLSKSSKGHGPKQSLEKSTIDRPESRLSRSPLTPIKDGNLLENGNDDKSCVKNLFTETDNKTPVKMSTEKNHVIIEVKSDKNWTPKKSPFKEYLCSPVKTESQTSLQDVLSPSKSGSTVSVKALDLAEVGDMFGDEWDIGEIEEVCK